ncbi:MAG: hypothetical protein QNJ97_25620 [Myxococcota bacterium]|nr:hypothetical protein [Myxococcota bacterium]
MGICSLAAHLALLSVASSGVSPSDLAEIEAARRADQEQEDPINLLPQGAREVIGNEANPAISIILDVAGAFFSQEDRMHQGGHAPNTNGPAIQGAELAASAAIDPFFRINAAFGLYHLHLEEIFLTTTALPLNLQVRAGKFKSNIGRHNPTHLHMWHFVLHPLPNEYLFGAEGMALPGAEISVLLPLPWYVEAIGTLQLGEAGSFRTKPASQGDPGFDDFIYPLRLVQFFDPCDDLALQFGLNAVFGTSPSGPEVGNRTYAYGADIFYKWRPIGWGDTGYTYIAWTAEGWYRQVEVSLDLWKDAGGYSDLIFGLTKEWEIALRGEYWRRIAGDTDNPAIQRDNYGRNSIRASSAVSFMPTHFSRVRFQYTFEHVKGFSNDTHIALIQLEVSAGAHGAHRY